MTGAAKTNQTLTTEASTQRRVLYALPALAAVVPALALSHTGAGIVAGTALWAGRWVCRTPR